MRAVGLRSNDYSGVAGAHCGFASFPEPPGTLWVGVHVLYHMLRYSGSRRSGEGDGDGDGLAE